VRQAPRKNKTPGILEALFAHESYEMTRKEIIGTTWHSAAAKTRKPRTKGMPIERSLAVPCI
jgi:hypothetical protein